MLTRLGRNETVSRRLGALAFVVMCALLGSASRADAAFSPPAFPAALCQVVYPLDQYPGAEGYHYIFFGNAFFINDGGYLLTAAHVLSSFRDGGQPHIIVGPPEGPRRLYEATVVAADYEHDVALLRAEPNPFEDSQLKGAHHVAYLPIAADMPVRGDAVLADSLRSDEVENAYSLDAPREEFAKGEVLDYRFRREEGTPDSEVLLVSQEVLPGQSGSPLVSADSQGVVGVIVGRWLGPVASPSAASSTGTKRVTLSSGVALRIHYAISLLQQNHVAWYTAAGSEAADEAANAESAAAAANVPAKAPAKALAKEDPPAAKPAAAQQDAAQTQHDYTPPEPLSVVGTPYPPTALFGGEVRLDALVDADGKLSDVRVVSGSGAFLDAALASVETWSFLPAKLDDRAVDARIGIVFDFPQSFLPKVTPGERKYEEPLAESSDRGALPVSTVDSEYPASSVVEGSVILYDRVDAEGHVASTEILRSVDALVAPTENAVDQWEFAPGKRGGIAAESGLVIVTTYRRPAI